MNKILNKFLLIPTIVGLILPSAGLAQTRTLDARQQFLDGDAKKLQAINEIREALLNIIERVARDAANAYLSSVRPPQNPSGNEKKRFEDMITMLKTMIASEDRIDRKGVSDGPIGVIGKIGGYFTGRNDGKAYVIAYGMDGKESPVTIGGGTTYGIFNEAFKKLAKPGGLAESFLDDARVEEFMGNFPKDLDKYLEALEQNLDGLSDISKSTSDFDDKTDPLPKWLDYGDWERKDKEEMDNLIGELRGLITEKKKMIDEARAAGILNVKTEDKKTGSIKDETGSSKRYAAAQKYVNDNTSFFQNLAISSGMGVRVKVGGVVLATFSSSPSAGQVSASFSRPNQVLTSFFARPSVPAYTPTAPTARPIFQYQAPQLVSPSVQYSR